MIVCVRNHRTADVFPIIRIKGKPKYAGGVVTGGPPNTDILYDQHSQRPLSTCHLCPPRPAAPGGPSHWPQRHSGPPWLRRLGRTGYTGLEATACSPHLEHLVLQLDLPVLLLFGVQMDIIQVPEAESGGWGQAWLGCLAPLYLPPPARQQLRATAGFVVRVTRGWGLQSDLTYPVEPDPGANSLGQHRTPTGGPVTVPAPESCLPWRAPMNHSVSGVNRAGIMGACEQD